MINKRIRLITCLGENDDEDILTEIYEILKDLAGEERNQFFDNIFVDGNDQAFVIRDDPHDYDHIEFVPLSESRLMEISGQPTLFNLEI